METILKTVQDIEKQASDQVKQAEKLAESKLANTRASSAKILKEVKSQAERKADEMVKDAVSQAKTEAGRLIEDQEASLKAIDQQARSNQERAKNHVIDLVRQTIK